MSSTTSMANTDSGERALDTTSAHNNASIADSDARRSSHHQPTEIDRALDSTQHDGLNHHDRTSANSKSEMIHNSASPINPPGDGDSEEEPGAFDDSHLQVDKPKKKKKKKSRRPKSKRGLVILPYPSLILII